MIGYPFDSIVTFDEHGTPNYDRGVSSKPLKALISKLFSTGVMPNPSNNLQVTAGSEGMTVVVKPGFCVIEGGLKLEERDRTLVIGDAHSTLDRIDTVVMRWDGNDNVRACDLHVISGTPATNPVRPTLTRVGSIYEIGLADILVPAIATSISQSWITDTRYDSERCGIVSSVSEWDTTTIYQQVQSDLAEFKDVEEADFIAWYQTVKDLIDQVTAARLQNEINAIVDSYVKTFNNRKGDVTLQSNDVTNALGYTPPKQDTNTSSGITRTPTTHVPGSNVEASLLAINKVETFTVAVNDWIANNNSSTSTDYPFIAVISTSVYTDDSVPVWQMIGAGTITTRDEEKQCAKVLQAYFSINGVTLYATEAPNVALKLHVKGV